MAIGAVPVEHPQGMVHHTHSRVRGAVRAGCPRGMYDAGLASRGIATAILRVERTTPVRV